MSASASASRRRRRTAPPPLPARAAERPGLLPRDLANAAHRRAAQHQRQTHTNHTRQVCLACRFARRLAADKRPSRLAPRTLLILALPRLHPI